MELAYYSLIGATSALVFLTVLFRFESKKGERILLVRARNGCDLFFEKVNERTHEWFGHLGQGTIRQTSHFLAHRLLQILLNVTRRLEKSLKRLQLKNRQVAHSDLASEHIDERMSEVRSHADMIRLSPEEKRKKRRELLK